MKFKIEPIKYDYTLTYSVYYKRGFFSIWRMIGTARGYSTLDECIKFIKEFKEANKNIKEINEELKNEKGE